MYLIIVDSNPDTFEYCERKPTAKKIKQVVNASIDGSLVDDDGELEVQVYKLDTTYITTRTFTVEESK